MSKGGVRYHRSIPANEQALKLAKELKAAVGDEKGAHGDAPRALGTFIQQLEKRLAERKP